MLEGLVKIQAVVRGMLVRRGFMIKQQVKKLIKDNEGTQSGVLGIEVNSNRQ